MRQSVFSPIRDGHFFWCGNISRINKHGCFRCLFQVYLIALVFNVAIGVLEFYGSSRTHSLSLLSDAFHVVFDSFTYLTGLLAAWHGSRVSHDNERFEKSQLRFRMITAFLIAFASLVILNEVWKRFQVDTPPEIFETGLLFQIASIGLVGNVIVLVMLWLFGIEHEHEGCNHSHGRDEILRANLLHTLGDVFSSVLVVANAAIFSFSSNPLWRYLDVIVSVLIALLLLAQAKKMLFDKKKQ